MYSKVLTDCIEREKAGRDFVCDEKDRILLQEVTNEINKLSGLQLQYLAELAFLSVSGAGYIISQKIQEFRSEAVKGYLLHHLVSDKVKDCDRLILGMYMQYKISDEYIPAQGMPASAHIYTRYDNAFIKMRPKRLTEELLKLSHSPRDFCYLPLTMRMLAGWKPAALKPVLIDYLINSDVAYQTLGFAEDPESYYPPLSFIRRENMFTAIECLKQYPTDDVIGVLQNYLSNADPDIRLTAKMSLKTIMRKVDKARTVL